MSSQIDPSVIRDDAKVDKRDLRNQFQIAADEITALQNVTSVSRKMAFDDTQLDTI